MTDLTSSCSHCMNHQPAGQTLNGAVLAATTNKEAQHCWGQQACVTWKVGTVLQHLSATVVVLHACTRLCLQTQLGSLTHVMLIHDMVAMDHVLKQQICIIINLALKISPHHRQRQQDMDPCFPCFPSSF